MSDKLDVFWENDKVGVLSVDSNRRFVFEYADEWLARSGSLPLSLSLPLNKGPFTENAVHTFFSNLLPESHVKELIARRLGLSLRNDFALLEALAGDCAGALSLLPRGEIPDKSVNGSSRYMRH